MLRVKLILGDSTETLSGFQTQDKILDLLSTPELLFMEDFDKKKIIFLEVKYECISSELDVDIHASVLLHCTYHR